MLQICAIVITRNEQENISRCIKSLGFASQVVVVDANSTDNTAQIARELGADVFVREWTNFSDQKTFAVQQAKHPWIFWIDADEQASPELAEEIKNLNPDTADGYFVSRKVFYLGRWIKHCGWYPGYVLRLFDKTKGRFNSKPVHEGVRLEGSTRKLKFPLYHFPYKNIFHHIEKINTYTDLAATHLVNKGKKPAIMRPFYKSLIKFTRMYVVRLGILDGASGLAICALGAVTDFLKHLKHWEKSRNFPPAPRKR